MALHGNSDLTMCLLLPVLDAPGKLGKILLGMNRALGEVPVTVKLRTGVKDNRLTAHSLMPRLATEWNAACVTVCSAALAYPMIVR
jgi:hypothetical protein